MSDLDDEIRSHLEHEIDDNMARGMTRDQAEAAAYRKFGNRTRMKEDVWRLRPWAWLDGVPQDLRYALRMMRKNWGFTAIAVASLALGIGGNTALFSLVDRLMLRTLAVREPERLVQLTATRRFSSPGHPFFTYPDYEVLRTLEFFEGIVGWNNRVVEVEWNGEKRQRKVTLVTGDYFPTLGVRPAIGRLLDTKDDSPAGGDAAVISHALWEREFQLKPSVLGQRFRWRRGLFTVVGVLPPAFHGVEVDATPEIFLATHSLPLIGDKEKLQDTGSPNLLTLMALLKPGVAPEQVASVLRERWPKLAQHGRPAPGGFTSKLILTPGYAGFSRLQSQFGYGLWILLGLSGVVLAAACANLASLQLLRGDARREPVAVRGGRVGRVDRQPMDHERPAAVPTLPPARLLRVCPRRPGAGGEPGGHRGDGPDLRRAAWLAGGAGGQLEACRPWLGGDALRPLGQGGDGAATGGVPGADSGRGAVWAQPAKPGHRRLRLRSPGPGDGRLERVEQHSRI